MEPTFLQDYLWFSKPTGVPLRQGMEVLAVFDAPVENLSIRNGKLVALVNGMWHIIPRDPPPTASQE